MRKMLSSIWRWLRGRELYWLFVSKIATPLLRLIDAETAHDLSINFLKNKLAPIESNSTNNLLKNKVFAIDFLNPLGLAAGYDKQAQVSLELCDMGFGFVEIGGVTPMPQAGNDKPRLFRLKEDRSIVNRFGLNSQGHEGVIPRLAAMPQKKPGIIGVNIAKNTNSSDTVLDYIQGVQKLGPLADFIVVNVSCPNVAWTKAMQQNDDAMSELVFGVKKARDALAKPPKLLLKLGPDMDAEQKKHMARLALNAGIDGLVISNTTSKRPGSLKSHWQKENGGLSGAALKESALLMLKDMYRLTAGKIPIIGVGGIASGLDAYERIRAGASLVQIYTCLVYNGPQVIRQIKADLAKLLIRDGFNSINEAIGIDLKEEMNSLPKV